MADLLQGSGFITGAASGIGKATAISFLEHGIEQIALGDINAEAIKNTAAELQSRFSKATILLLVVDVTDEASIERAIQEIVEKFGRLDYAVNNAGVAGANTPSAVTPTVEWQKLLNVNLNGVWMSSRAECRQMLKQEYLRSGYNRGVIINVASMFGIVSSPKTIPACAYTAAKHAVIGLTKADAVTYASDGIRINAICPGWVQYVPSKRLLIADGLYVFLCRYVGTPLLQAATESEVMQKETAKVPMERMAQMSEIADAIVFLASHMSSYMCGTALIVDG
ncbi:hypothetical protein LTR13_000921 [Exophiala sideris]|nr:hypothetical protein LTR13_000921 [Exophiala sideris]